jgi:hypothetical protein
MAAAELIGDGKATAGTRKNPLRVAGSGKPSAQVHFDRIVPAQNKNITNDVRGSCSYLFEASIEDV